MKQRGISYLETIAAVAMLGIAVLSATSITAVHPVASARLAAQDEMVAALDATLELVRAGEVPLSPGRVPPSPFIAPSVRIDLELEDGARPGLVWVRATARTTVRGKTLERSMTTALWRPS